MMPTLVSSCCRRQAGQRDKDLERRGMELLILLISECLWISTVEHPNRAHSNQLFMVNECAEVQQGERCVWSLLHPEGAIIIYLLNI